MRERRSRSAREVLDDHLRLSQDGSLETDMDRNYAEDVVVLCGRGVFRGRDGMRRLADFLKQELPGARFEYRTRLVEGEMGFLEWGAQAAHTKVEDGADSFLIRDGRIVAQTIHYTVQVA